MTRGRMASITETGMKTTGVGEETKVTGVEEETKVTGVEMTDANVEVAGGQLSERRSWKASKGLRGNHLLFLHQRPFPMPPPPPPDRKSLEKVAMCQGLNELLMESEEEGESRDL